MSDVATLAAGTAGTGGSVPNDRLDLAFETGNVNTDVGGSELYNWTQVTSTWPNGTNWKRTTDNAEINTRCATLVSGGLIAAASYNTPAESKFHRTWASDTGVLVSIIAAIKSIGWKKYGDNAKVDAYVLMTVTGDLSLIHI